MNLLRKYYNYESIGGGIPDEVRRKIEEKYPLTGNSFNDVFMLDLQKDALWGYSLASEEISRLKAENERLRGEVEKLQQEIKN